MSKNQKIKSSVESLKIKNKKKHLSKEERFCIEKMLGVGDSLIKIAKTLGRGKSTISEEVSSNGGRDSYTARLAIQRAYLKQYWKKKNCNKVSMDSHLTKFTSKKLELGWSPEAISSRLRIQSGLKFVSPKSIRKFIGKRAGLERYLFWNRNHHKSGRKRSKDKFLADPDRKWIEQRPIEALYEYGHWEMDFIVSKHNSRVLLVLVEKYSKIVKLALLPNRNNQLVNRTIASLLKDRVVKSITTDNDIAFTHWKELENMVNSQIFFCHPYHSWEKGLVENTNRWIREFIPKKTDLKSISSDYLLAIEDYFNHKARVCLSGRTAYEVAMEKECGVLLESLEVKFPGVRVWG
jgi:IS30 family transposase